ncbi:hypothetical protein [Foetidibacter luteolus]|uniref:hypothetical protein n=1 Tax=Foetidibacter luteolus TaxID=2608880 RepID=UPI00129A7528|nr:hypothetical protein [Foetidibacter luteolus]
MFKKIFAVSVLILSIHKGFCQPVISGPACIAPNTVYQYILGGNIDSLSTVHVCITGGIILDTLNPGTCKDFPGNVNQVFVVWNDSATQGKLTASSANGNGSITVRFAPELMPGLIDSSSKSQMISYQAIPAAINCGSDSGGSCSPSYEYQWKYSSDQVSWDDMDLATSGNLLIESALTQTTFYRRKVTELSSGSIGYSDVASVFVIVTDADSSGLTSNSLRHTHTNNPGEVRVERRLVYQPGASPQPLSARRWAMTPGRRLFQHCETIFSRAIM